MSGKTDWLDWLSLKNKTLYQCKAKSCWNAYHHYLFQWMSQVFISLNESFKVNQTYWPLVRYGMSFFSLEFMHICILQASMRGSHSHHNSLCAWNVRFDFSRLINEISALWVEFDFYNPVPNRLHLVTATKLQLERNLMLPMKQCLISIDTTKNVAQKSQYFDNEFITDNIFFPFSARIRHIATQIQFYYTFVWPVCYLHSIK